MTHRPRLLALTLALGVGSGIFSAAPAVADTIRAEATPTQCTAASRITAPVPALSLMQSDLAWGVTRGEGVTVAVVDSGVAASNPHLRDVVVGGINLVGDGADPSGLTDTYGHGTAIAGQIAAQLIDGSSVEGLAPGARILSVRVFSGVSQQETEAGFGPSTPRLADGIKWAADQGAQIINVSMSTTQDEPVLRDAVAYATSRGSLVVASSGNRDSELGVEKSESDGARYPAGVPGVLGVAAADLGGVVTESSIHGPHVALSAVGQAIPTASLLGGDCSYADDAPKTSFATAYVSAAAALVASAHPNETPAQWAYRLEVTAVRADPDARDDRAGWGVVQPYEAIVLIPGAGIRGPESPFVDAEPSADPAVSADPVQVVDRPDPDAEAKLLGFSIGLAGLVLLAAAGSIGVFIARRRGERATASAPTGRGLYRDEETRAS